MHGNLQPFLKASSLLSGRDIWFNFRLHQWNIAHVDGCDKRNNLGSIWKYLVWLFARKLRSKEADMWKSWNSIKQKKILYINFLKLEYVLLWPMVDFCLKVAQIWDLLTEIQGFEASARRPRTLESWTTNDKFELLLGRNGP